MLGKQWWDDKDEHDWSRDWEKREGIGVMLGEESVWKERYW